MARFFKNNGLTIVLMLMFLASVIGQWLTGWRVENEELVRHGEQPIGVIAFLRDAQFLSTLFENWESEFLQMTVFVVLTAMLFQKGAAESEDPDQAWRDGPLSKMAGNTRAPAAVRKGPVIRWIYAHSLGIVLLILFIASFLLHWIFSAKFAAEEAAMHGEAAQSLG